MRYALRPAARRRGHTRIDARPEPGAAGRCEQRQRGRASGCTQGQRPVPRWGRRGEGTLHQARRARLPAAPQPAGRRGGGPADAARARAARPAAARLARDAPRRSRLGRGRAPVHAPAPRLQPRLDRRRLRLGHARRAHLLPARGRPDGRRARRLRDAVGPGPALRRPDAHSDGPGALLPPRRRPDRRRLRRPARGRPAALGGRLPGLLRHARRGGRGGDDRLRRLQLGAATATSS